VFFYRHVFLLPEQRRMIKPPPQRKRKTMTPRRSIRIGDTVAEAAAGPQGNPTVPAPAHMNQGLASK